MANIFMKTSHNDFSWEKLGDIKAGRADLGESMPVIVYRLLEYSMNDILHKEYGADVANDLFRRAGYLAGTEFAKNVLNLTEPMDAFVAHLQEVLRTLQIGILRVEDFQESTGEFTLTVAEDLDCSGLPPSGEVVCNYDEGFLAGIMEAYTGKPYQVREIDCWASGDRVCRFKGKVKKDDQSGSGASV